MQMHAFSMIQIQSDGIYVSLFSMSCRNSFNYIQTFCL